MRTVATAGTVNAQPDAPESEPNIVTLIKNDQQVTPREEPVDAPELHHDSSIVRICWSILFVLYIVYGLVQRMIVSRAESETSEALASTLTMEVTYPTDIHSNSIALTRVLYFFSYTSTQFAIISLLIGIYTYTCRPAPSSPPNCPIIATHIKCIGHERTQHKSKKRPPR